MQRSYRSFEQMNIQLLRILEQGETVKTRIMYKLATTHHIIEDHLDDCLSAGLIYYENNKPHISLRGKRYLELSEKIDEILGETISGGK